MKQYATPGVIRSKFRKSLEMRIFYTNVILCGGKGDCQEVAMTKSRKGHEDYIVDNMKDTR